MSFYGSSTTTTSYFIFACKYHGKNQIHHNAELSPKNEESNHYFVPSTQPQVGMQFAKNQPERAKWGSVHENVHKNEESQTCSDTFSLRFVDALCIPCVQSGKLDGNVPYSPCFVDPNRFEILHALRRVVPTKNHGREDSGQCA